MRLTTPFQYTARAVLAACVCILLHGALAAPAARAAAYEDGTTLAYLIELFRRQNVTCPGEGGYAPPPPLSYSEALASAGEDLDRSGLPFSASSGTLTASLAKTGWEANTFRILTSNEHGAQAAFAQLRDEQCRGLRENLTHIGVYRGDTRWWVILADLHPVITPSLEARREAVLEGAGQSASAAGAGQGSEAAGPGAFVASAPAANRDAAAAVPGTTPGGTPAAPDRAGSPGGAGRTEHSASGLVSVPVTGSAAPVTSFEPSLPEEPDGTGSLSRESGSAPASVSVPAVAADADLQSGSAGESAASAIPPARTPESGVAAQETARSVPERKPGTLAAYPVAVGSSSSRATAPEGTAGNGVSPAAQGALDDAVIDEAAGVVAQRAPETARELAASPYPVAAPARNETSGGTAGNTGTAHTSPGQTSPGQASPGHTSPGQVPAASSAPGAPAGVPGNAGAGVAAPLRGNAAVSTPVSPASLPPEARAMLEKINSARAGNGPCPDNGPGTTGALRPESVLMRVAAEHSRSMSREGYFNTVTPAGSTMQQRLLENGYIRQTMTVLIARGPADPAAIFQLWSVREDQCRQIMNPLYTDIGIGYADGYWTLVLALPAPVHAPLSPANDPSQTEPQPKPANP